MDARITNSIIFYYKEYLDNRIEQRSYWVMPIMLFNEETLSVECHHFVIILHEENGTFNNKTNYSLIVSKITDMCNMGKVVIINYGGENQQFLASKDGQIVCKEFFNPR